MEEPLICAALPSYAPLHSDSAPAPNILSEVLRIRVTRDVIVIQRLLVLIVFRFVPFSTLSSNKPISLHWEFKVIYPGFKSSSDLICALSGCLACAFSSRQQNSLHREWTSRVTSSPPSKPSTTAISHISRLSPGSPAHRDGYDTPCTFPRFSVFCRRFPLVTSRINCM